MSKNTKTKLYARIYSLISFNNLSYVLWNGCFILFSTFMEIHMSNFLIKNFKTAK